MHLFADFFFGDDAGTQRIINIVINVGNAVGKAHQAPFESGGFFSLGVAENPVAHLRGQVQASALFFEFFDHTHALLVVPKTGRIHIIKCALAGVPEGSVPQIVPQGDCLGQILIEPQSAGNGARNLRHL